MNGTPFNASQTDGTKSNNTKPDKSDQDPQSDEPVVLPSGGEVNVGYKERPSSPSEDKKIHPRRPLPVVPDRPPNEE
jgi:hypothetical protein